MAITQDGWLVDTFVAALNNDIALDLTANTFNIAMFTNSVVPDFSQVGPAYGSAPWNANEVSGTGYSAGGKALTTPLFQEHPTSPGTARWDFGDVSWTGSTISNAKGALIYVPALSNRAVLLRNFGSAYSTVSGTFSITWHSDGIWKNLLVV